MSHCSSTDYCPDSFGISTQHLPSLHYLASSIKVCPSSTKDVADVIFSRHIEDPREALMNFDNNARAIAEMFTDMADMFCESVDHDSVQMLLHYSLDASGLQNGKIILDAFGEPHNIVASVSAPLNHCETSSSYLSQRARATLHTEFSITGDSGRVQCEYAFPMRVRGICLGVISLFSLHKPPLSEHTMAVLQSIADIAATTIDQTHRINQAYLLVSQLQNALDSRVLIEQAKGVLAERNKVDFSKAFHEMRTIARQEQRPIRAVAAEIVANHHCHTSSKSKLAS